MGLRKRLFITIFCLTIPAAVLPARTMQFKYAEPDDVAYIEPGAQDIIEYDYIIVGAGSAGSILARKLSDDHKKRVLVIERGDFYYNDPVINDPNFAPHQNDLFYNPKYAKVFPVIFNPSIVSLYSEGAMVGGGAGHNNLIAVRGTPDIYNGWAASTGNPRWRYDSLLPKMIAVETYTPNSTIPNPLQRGFSGPIGVTQSSPIAGNATLATYSSVTGSPITTDYNDYTLATNPVGTNQQFITPLPDSHRSYSAKEFLPMGTIIDEKGVGLHGRKLRIVTKARALNFLVDEVTKKACAVRFVYTGKTPKVYTAYLKDNGILISSAGAISTPAFLFHSGVGPAAELAALQKPVIVDSPNVGKNLQNQYGASASISGVLGVHALVNAFPDLRPYMPADAVRRMQDILINAGPNAWRSIGFISNPKSRGSIEIVDADPLVDPKVNLNMYSDGNFSTPGTDAYLIVSFYKIMKAVAAAAVPTQTVTYPTPADYAAGDAGLFAAATALGRWSITFHIVGTTRMASSIADGVVDGNLSVFGLKNVKIGDIGIEPETVNGNPTLSAYYIALNLAAILGVPTPPPL